MSLGQLAIHVARIPSDISRLAQLDTFDVSAANFQPPQPGSTEEILSALDKSVSDTTAYFNTLTLEAMSAPWRLTARGNEVLAVPRAAMLRSVLFNH
jgi:hypothetical protein